MSQFCKILTRKKISKISGKGVFSGVNAIRIEPRSLEHRDKYPLQQQQHHHRLSKDRDRSPRDRLMPSDRISRERERSPREGFCHRNRIRGRVTVENGRPEKSTCHRIGSAVRGNAFPEAVVLQGTVVSVPTTLTELHLLNV